MEARIRPQRVKRRIDANPRKVSVVLFVTLFQPFEGFSLPAEIHEDRRDKAR